MGLSWGVWEVLLSIKSTFYPKWRTQGKSKFCVKVVPPRLLNKMLSITLQALASFASPYVPSAGLLDPSSPIDTPLLRCPCFAFSPNSAPLVTSLFYPTHNEEMQLINQHRRKCCSKKSKLNIQDTVSSPMKFTKT